MLPTISKTNKDKVYLLNTTAQKAIPAVGKLEDAKRFSAFTEFVAVQKAHEAMLVERYLGANAEQLPRLVITVDPGPAGNHVGAHLAAADLLVLDTQRAARPGSGPGPLGRPVLHLG